MRGSALLLTPVCLFVVSCGGGMATGEPAASSPQQASVPALPTDTAIIAKIYDPYYAVPAGFFVDERAGSPRSYTVHHVMDATSSYELCSDDFETAAAWEQADNATRAVNGYYVGAYENARYFEFIRELSYDDDIGNVGDPTSPGYARVFKCSNTSRDGVDRQALSGFAGTLNAQPLDPDQVREFAEYLWPFTFFPQRYKKVLDSYPGPGPYSRTLLLGFASTQGTGRCDRIDVAEWRFVADPGSGQVSSEFVSVHTFEAQLVNGSPLLCD